jgi:RNA polymerase sigma-70 factor (ECF subfamily)
VSKPDEQSLVIDLQSGRPEACAELVRGHYRPVYRFLVHLTGNVHEAEDLTQETFAVAWERFATFEGRANLGTWLHRIAYTKFIDSRRAAKRRGRWEKSRPTGPASEPIEAVMADDEIRCIHRALGELNPPERTLLVLHYLQGLSYREMAMVLDEPTGTIKWRTTEALNHMRDLMTDEVPNHAS